MTIVQNPRQFKVPDWMLNRKKDTKDGKFSQVVSNTLDMKLREDLERLKKIRAHRGLRHYCARRTCRCSLSREVFVPLSSARVSSLSFSLFTPFAVFFSSAGGLRVRGQRTKTTGRKGRTVGVSKKKG